MQVESLILKLRKEKEQIENKLKVLESFIEPSKAKKTLKGRKVENHWMKKPENKARVLRIIKKMHKARKEQANVTK